MCYRYSLKKLATIAALAEDVAADIPPDWQPRYNVALTNPMPVVVKAARPELRTLAFGFSQPPRTPGEPPLLIANARAETVLMRPAFREAAHTRRCLIPADGFYEWEKQGTTRLPHYFYLREHRPFFLAGLWQPANGHSPAGFAIVTTQANALLRPIHDRMPVLLGPNSGPAWLGNEPLAPAQFERFCRPLSAEMMGSHRVDPRMNNVRYQEADCLAPI